MPEQPSDVPSHSSPSFFTNASGVTVSDSTFQIIVHNGLPNSDPSAAYSPEPLTSNMETYAQREQDLSVDGHELYTQSRCFQIISLLCFSAPDLYLKNLLKLCAGNTLDMAILGDTIGKLLKEWKDVLVLSALLLITNTLLIMFEDQAQLRWRLLSVRLSCLSTVICVVIMMVGSLLIRRHQDMIREPSSYVHDILQRHLHDPKDRDIEILALKFSSPYGLLMWGLTVFLLAFVVIVIDTVGGYTKIFLFISMTAVGSLILYWSVRCINIILTENPV